MKKTKIKSYCKINLYLKILKKLNSGYHKINSLVTFCDLHDVISISKISSKKDLISFSGKFKKRINFKSNTISKLLYLLREKNLLKKENFKINIKKNIPHGSGLGGGSSNAASLLNFINSRMKLKLKKNEIKKIAEKIGFDVPVGLEKKNAIITGKKGEVLRFDKKFNFNILIAYPNIICSTKAVYLKNKIISGSKSNFKNKINNTRKLVLFLKSQSNDLEKIVFELYPKVKNLIEFVRKQNGCYFARITGSGSACFGIFASMKSANQARKLIKIKFPNYWCMTSKTI